MSWYKKNKYKDPMLKMTEEMLDFLDYILCCFIAFWLGLMISLLGMLLIKLLGY